MENQTIKLWAFYYCPMIYESASYIESYHRTKKGALKAMKEHKAKERLQWVEDQSYHKKWCKEEGFKYRPSSKFGQFESWHVRRFELIVLD